MAVDSVALQDMLSRCDTSSSFATSLMQQFADRALYGLQEGIYTALYEGHELAYREAPYFLITGEDYPPEEDDEWRDRVVAEERGNSIWSTKYKKASQTLLSIQKM